MTEDEEKKRNSLKEQFEEIDASYNGTEEETADSGLTLERKQVDALSDEELETMAKDSLRDYYSNGVQSILDSNEKSVSNLNSKAEKAIETANSSQEKLNNEVDVAKQNAQNQAIRRGLARSSIIMNQLEGYDKLQIEESAKIQQNLDNQISQINFEIESLNSRLEDSLKAFDLSYAVKLQNKINNLKEEQTKKIEKALEYNNKIALQEAQYNSKQKELSAKYGTNNSSTIETNSASKAKYEVAKSYFAALPKEDALNELLNTSADFLRSQLGNYYFKLYNEIVAR